MKVEHLTYQTHWVKGKENIEADALSHNPCVIQTNEWKSAQARSRFLASVETRHAMIELETFAIA
jgi:hypothetical protein